MTAIHEDLLVRNGNYFNLDSSLPLRLQKRQLLKLLGFPIDDNLTPCRASEGDRAKALFKEYSELVFPFLILVSEKPSRTTIYPLFIVRAQNDIVWRDDENKKRKISYSEATQVIANYKLGTWLEFTGYIWGQDTLAGRILYVGPNEQIIEMQTGISPNQLLWLGEDVFPVYSGATSYFELSLDNYREAMVTLRSIGHKQFLPFSTVQRVVKNFGHYHFDGFEKLSRVAPMLTLEFGITKNQKLVCVDIDWPSQWKGVSI